jgi:hypothetical protein
VVYNMSTKQCGQCGEILVKQSLNTDGTVLNASLKLEYDKYIDNYNRMLECSECGGMCYHSNKKTNPPHDGHGLCKKCGGDKRKPTKNEKKLFENENRKKFNLFNFKIWSCPVHGTHDRPKDELLINKELNFISLPSRPHPVEIIHLSAPLPLAKGKEAIDKRWAAAKEGRFEDLPSKNIKVYQYIRNMELMKNVIKGESIGM